ncbi:MAG: tetratricopeptide repeat protein [Bacteroidota bacterium]
MKPVLIIMMITCLLSCIPDSENTTYSVSYRKDEPAPTTGIKSFMGEELPRKQLSERVRKKYEKNLEKAENDLYENPTKLDPIIWYGRRLAYLGRYQKAIDAYSNGLKRYPASYQLMRHRGHCYIITRQIGQAIDDFELAVFHSTGVKNAIEPDGIPNILNKPLRNNKFNIWYHFGFAYYLSGRFDKAVAAYKRCMDFSDNDDLLVATSYWLYLSAKRIGNDEMAAKALKNVSTSMKLIENTKYFDLILLFKGAKKVEELLRKAEDKNGLLNPTLAYGIGNWYLQNGQVDDARNIFWKTLEHPNWDAFGYIATEADIQNMATSVD